MARKRRLRRNEDEREFTADDILKMRDVLYREADKLSKAMAKPHRIAHHIATDFYGAPDSITKKTYKLWDILRRAWSMVDRIRDSS